MDGRQESMHRVTELKQKLAKEINDQLLTKSTIHSIIEAASFDFAV